MKELLNNRLHDQRYEPEIREFLDKVKEVITRRNVPDYFIIEAFSDQVFDVQMKPRKEDPRTDNLGKVYSLFLYTERFDGAEDYTDAEIQFMDLMIKFVFDKDPDLRYHRNTRLILPSKN